MRGGASSHWLDICANRAQSPRMELPPPNPGTITTTKEERTWAMVCHLGGLATFIIPFGNIVAPLVIWMLKKDTMPLVNDQGKEALNFQITYTLAFIIATVLVFVAVGILLLPVIGIAWLILMILAGVKANEGVAYRYPAILRLVT